MERYRFTEEVQAALESLRQPLAIYQFIDNSIATIVLSDGFCEMLGYQDREEAYHDMDTDLFIDVHPDDVARVTKATRHFATEGGKYNMVYRIRTRNRGGYRILHAMGFHVQTDEGARLVHVSYTDEGAYTESQRGAESALNSALANALRQESMLKENYYDYLTGLPNMTYFFELAEDGKAELVKKGKRYVFLFFDISGMKYFNKTYGFAEGDEYLKKVADLLRNTFGNENCCRIGGDHFAVFAKKSGVEKILKNLFKEFRSINDRMNLPVRVGIYVSRTENLHASLACDAAKVACDSLRNTYASGFKYYDKELRDNLVMRQYILMNFERALRERWIHVYYQPIVRAVNGRICDEEALARWIDPKKGLISPGEFIPCLEDTGEIFKLDLYVLDRILEKIKELQAAGLQVVPQSLNLSRADFDACDIVEEVRSRVDEAGVSRSMITVEITESTVGSNFEFMKNEVKRFQELGFPVWMDDFGSGYSSIDVLQSIKFNLIKFDMSFVKRLDEGTEGKIILTEMMRMAIALGVDTISEGVETLEQARFLREIGCSKLQGFYFSRPLPLEEAVSKYKTDFEDGFENSAESGYYEKIGRVNLYDLSVIENKDEIEFHNIFNTLPMSIMEIDDNSIMNVRSNQAYLEFEKRFFRTDESGGEADGSGAPGEVPGEVEAGFMEMVRECCRDVNRAFCDQQMPDGSVIHAVVRRLTQNPVTGRKAVALAVLSITDPGEGATFENIARALAADYYLLYYVDLETYDFIEYSSPVGREELVLMHNGKNFFGAARKFLMARVYEEDRLLVTKSITKDTILKGLDEEGAFKIVFRVNKDDKPVHIALKAMRMWNNQRHIILGVSPVENSVRLEKI